MQKRIFIGTSGWSYKHWKGTFYPPEVKAKDEFHHYLDFFPTVELNSPFYRLPPRETFAKWRDQAPNGFLYSVKANRFITHMKKLKEPSQILTKFFDSVTALEEKLGPILFQLPPLWNLNLERLEEFLKWLPPEWRYVFEFRNKQWYAEPVIALLTQHNCAFCIYDLDSHLSPIEITADFVYVRLHGPTGKYAGSYSDEALRQWAERCLNWAKSKDVFVYFDNDIGTAAPFDAQRLMALVRREHTL